ncbi:hypothetical protein [Rariglobus hedericola]|uniref:Verru_Chthon cassette protein A n=1 Tax=Rariglobus hedericola TaxID=2597822 RepID=A0A556QPI8_9BACT|nr:hypothetical protein [Rariglobus hedericola]TSJ78560.1 hypothetical protein FPL22_04470 [Rariglobus hedericola]
MSPRAQPRCRRSGFALLITITLLAFLVLLLVSLASLTRVETQVAANNQQLTRARQNALMGLNIALGQLQLMMGPDARISAPASQKGDGIASYATADADNNPNWIGVYRQNPSAATPRDPQLLAWLVSGNQTLTVNTSTANTPPVTPDFAVTTASGPLSKSVTAETSGLKIGSRDAVLLVGPASTLEVPATAAPASVAERFVVAPTEPITAAAGTVPGLDPAITPTIGHFAYWVGDEGVKAKASINDPWLNPAAVTPSTPAAQTEDYRFINAQRLGIEAVGQDTADTRLGASFPGADPVFLAALPKALSLAQLPLANADPAGRTALGLAAKSRFHDLTLDSYSLPVDVARGGLKRDLGAWIRSAMSTPHPSSPASPDDNFITPGDPADPSKFSLPKWQLIRDYATTTTGNTAVQPSRQTATQQGVAPVITYLRMGYNLTCPAADTPPDFNIMPVVTLWNPYNVKLAAKTYEFCVQYSNLVPASATGAGLRYRTGAYSPISPTNPALEPEDFDLMVIRVKHGSSPIVTKEYGENPSDTEAEYFRFKLEVSRDMEPGESRIFTICDAVDSPDGYDGTLYKGGVSKLSDRGALRNDVGINNAVRMQGQVPFNQYIVAQTQTIFLECFPQTSSTTYNSARMEVLLTEPLPSSIAPGNITAVRQYLRANAYQKIVGAGVEWRFTMNSRTIPPQNTGEPLLYHRLELMMSDLPTTPPESNAQDRLDKPNPGAPRWLSTLNPQASIMLRKPFVEQVSSGYRSNFNPSYLTEFYVEPPVGGTTLNLTKHDIPNADSQGRVSAGTRVSITSGGAQNMVIRELPSPDVPLFSIAQLQHANASLINLNPAYAIGNSHANLYVNRNASFTVLPTDDSFALSDPTGFPSRAVFNRIYDLSYWLNQALWDGYFFSTVPDTLTVTQAEAASYRLPNSRHAFVWSSGGANAADVAALKTVDQAAAHLRIDGGFNVNSTSIQAWRALLHTHNGIATDPADPLNKHPFSRFSTALSRPFAGITPNDTWMGYRILSDAQIDDLAPRIVAEIRARGPFLSLADFVNRRLVADRTGLKGVLQAAIDAGTINQDSANDGLKSDTYPRDIKDSSGKVPQDIEQQIVYSGTVNAANTAPDTTQSAASRAALTPGYLSQADLLTAIGPSLTARSDTFRIRTYGDSQNPATGEISGRAWCEAVVQRCHEYLDTTDAATVAPADLGATANQTFGRRFKIISFRWLSAHDI